MKEVIIYSTAVCKYCNMAKDFFKSRNVNYIEYNVGTDSARLSEMMQKSGQRGVPVIDVGGEVIVGFDEERLEQLFPAAT